MTEQRAIRFSIIVPVYNTGELLKRCVDSILAQNYDDFEIILVDDGSKDCGGEICDAYSASDKRIKTIHKTNAGLGMARNTGIDNATGDYVCFVDSDDYLRENLLKTLSTVISADNYDAIFFGMDRVSVDGDVLEDLHPKLEKQEFFTKEEVKNELLADYLGYDPVSGKRTNLRISVCTSCVNLSIIKDNNLRFVSERKYISEDLWFYLDIFKYLTRVKVLENSYYCYVQNQASLTSSYKADRFEKIVFFYDEAKKHAQMLGYSNDISIRLEQSFFSTVLGCLKIEAAATNRNGFFATYQRIKKICASSEMVHSLDVLPDRYFNRNWKLLKRLINRNQYLLIYCMLIIQYKRKGI